MIDITEILNVLRPGSEYGLLGKVIDEDSYEKNVDWRDSTIKPDFSKIRSELPSSQLRIASQQLTQKINDFIIKNITFPITAESISIIEILLPSINRSKVSPIFSGILIFIEFGINKKRELLASKNIVNIESYRPELDTSFPPLNTDRLSR